MISTHDKRRLPHRKFIGIAVGIAVLLIVLITIAIWLYVRKYRAPKGRRDWEGESIHYRLPPTSRTSWTEQLRASRYWSADDVGKEADVRISGLPKSEEATTWDSKTAIVSTPDLPCKSVDRSSKVVVLPLPDLKKGLYEGEGNVEQFRPVASYKSDIKRRSQVEEARPVSRRVRTWSKHISFQVLDTSKGGGLGLADARTRNEGDFSEVAQGVVTDLDWQEYR